MRTTTLLAALCIACATHAQTFYPLALDEPMSVFGDRGEMDKWYRLIGDDRIVRRGLPDAYMQPNLVWFCTTDKELAREWDYCPDWITMQRLAARIGDRRTWYMLVFNGGSLTIEACGP